MFHKLQKKRKKKDKRKCSVFQCNFFTQCISRGVWQSKIHTFFNIYSVSLLIKYLIIKRWIFWVFDNIWDSNLTKNIPKQMTYAKITGHFKLWYNILFDKNWAVWKKKLRNLVNWFGKGYKKKKKKNKKDFYRNIKKERPTGCDQFKESGNKTEILNFLSWSLLATARHTILEHTI